MKKIFIIIIVVLIMFSISCDNILDLITEKFEQESQSMYLEDSNCNKTFKGQTIFLDPYTADEKETTVHSSSFVFMHKNESIKFVKGSYDEYVRLLSGYSFCMQNETYIQTYYPEDVLNEIILKKVEIKRSNDEETLFLDFDFIRMGRSGEFRKRYKIEFITDESDTPEDFIFEVYGLISC